jgi:hypothetical protein
MPTPDGRKGCRAVKLADLPPGQYVRIVARVISVRAREVVDRLGAKQVLSGSLEDDTFSEGAFGLFVGAVNTAGFTVAFDEVAYWDLP